MNKQNCFVLWAARVALILIAINILWACANVGNPEGGPYDMTPPRLIQARPAQGELNVKQGRIRLNFDEYIKLSQQDKIIISPTQITSPTVTAVGKSVLIRLQDSLLPNTTYSIYFDDAIVDNNEDNPLEDLAYTFSTGNIIDSMQIGGVVLDAATLEPMSNLIIGAYFEEGDSAVLNAPFPFSSRTNKLGAFTIRGLRDSVYRVYALKDDDNNFRYNPLSEGFAFDIKRHRTTKLDSLRTDTIRIDSVVRRDTLYRDSLVTYKYTYYSPRDLVLLYFTPENKRMGIDRHSWRDSLSLSIDFLSELESTPLIHSLDKPDLPLERPYYPEHNGKNTVYWLRDTSLRQMDSLRFTIRYPRTDSTMSITQTTDTLTFYKPKQRQSTGKEAKESPFKLSFSSAKGIHTSTLRDSLILTSSLPIDSIQQGAITLEATSDSLYRPIPFQITPIRGRGLSWWLDFDRKLGTKFRATIDSAQIHSIYGHANDSTAYEQKRLAEEELGKLQIRILGLASDSLQVELLDKSGNTLMTKLAQRTTVADSTLTDSVLRRHLNLKESSTDSLTAYAVEFDELKPDDYYLRLFIDANADGRWTTGQYPVRLPETVYYSPTTYSVKKGFTTSEMWSPLDFPLSEQKPQPLQKVRPEEKKPRIDKNIEYYQRHPRK